MFTSSDMSTSSFRPVDPLRFCGASRRVQERRKLIMKAAYFRAMRRGFDSGHELEDWLAAEAEVDQRLDAEWRTHPAALFR